MKERILYWQKFIFDKIISFLVINKFECELFLVLAIFLTFVGRLPYVNILLGQQFFIFLLIIIAVVIFKISNKNLLLLILSFFLLALFYTIVGDLKTAELLGNQIYFLLWLLSFLYLKELWKEI